SPAVSGSVLYFARVLAPSDFGGTGFAIVNPGNTEAVLPISLYSQSGTVVATTTQRIPPGGQLSKLASDLFPNVASSGWVKATSDTNGLVGFWLGGDFTTYTD